MFPDVKFKHEDGLENKWPTPKSRNKSQFAIDQPTKRNRTVLKKQKHDEKRLRRLHSSLSPALTV